MKLLFLLFISLHWGGKKVTNTVHHTFCMCCEGLLIAWWACVFFIHVCRVCGYTARGKQDPLMEFLLSLYGVFAKTSGRHLCWLQCILQYQCCPYSVLLFIKVVTKPYSIYTSCCPASKLENRCLHGKKKNLSKP